MLNKYCFKLLYWSKFKRLFHIFRAYYHHLAFKSRHLIFLYFPNPEECPGDENCFDQFYLFKQPFGHFSQEVNLGLNLHDLT